MEVLLSVTVPDGINPEYIEKMGNKALSELISDTKVEIERDRTKTSILESDHALESFLVGRKSKAVVRENTYDDNEQTVISRQLYEFSDCYDRRRPVVMKGAYRALVIAYGWSNNYSANGWAYLVLNRFLKIKRITCLSREEISDTIDAISKALEKKHPFLSYHFRQETRSLSSYKLYTDGCRVRVLLRGDFVYLTKHQLRFIIEMKKIIDKSTKLDDRLKSLRRLRKKKGYMV